MTTTPLSIGSDQPIKKAGEMMQLHGIRHLPVLRGGKLIGILTDRDVKLISSLGGEQAESFAVEEAMTEDPYTVSPDTPLDEVTREMSAKRYGCAVVMQNHKVVGIFTTVDACQALSELLNTRLKK